MPMIDPQPLVREHLERNNWGLLGSQGYVMGVDLGGYGLRASLIDLHNHTYASAYADMQGHTPEVLLRDALQVAQGLLDSNDVSSSRLVRIGVGFGGPVDPFEGKVLLSTRVSGWEQFSLKGYFEEAFDTVTLVDNDANLIALGEATFGTGHGCQNLFYLHLSSGVGGGIVLDGRLYHGATSIAGEIGHVLVKDWVAGTEQSAATFEQLVSVAGLCKRAAVLGFATDNLNDIFGEHPVGQRVVQETVDYLALRIANVVALLDPQMVVLGGIVVRIGGDAFVQAIADRVHQYIAPAFARPVQVVRSVLGVHSISIGALALALESLRD